MIKSKYQILESIPMQFHDLVREYAVAGENERVTIRESKDCEAIFQPKIGHEKTERLAVAFLNRAGEVVGIDWELTKGNKWSTIIDPALIFREALLRDAPSIIVSHNHPSGSNRPSEADKTITARIRHSGEMLGITLLDHVIVTPTAGKYYSFADNGM